MKRILLALILLIPMMGAAQSEEPKLEFGGYIKFLQITQFFDDAGTSFPGSPITNNFFHNRLNLAWYPNENWTVVAQTRNRLFYGEQVKLTPGFGRSIDFQTGLADMSIRWIDKGGIVLHSIFDRAYVNYATEKLDVRLGRQRINWGLNLIWNPNDLFNALNFLDFDYEERPGTDALRVQYYTGILSKAEIAFAPDDTLENSTGAILYKFNAGGYDIQTIAGYFQGDLALGGGWEGNLGGAGFKGEGTAFIPLEPSEDSTASYVASFTLDYLLGNGIYASGAILYNSNGTSGGLGNQNGLFTGQPSAKNLFPSEWAYAINASGNINPLFIASGAIIYAPTNQLTIIAPTLAYSVKENWDIDLTAQALFWAPGGAAFGPGGSAVFLRLRWSY